MGMNDRDAPRIICDIETAPLLDAAEYLEDPNPPANYTKPETIAAWVEKQKAADLARCALDLDLCRIVAIGVMLRIGEASPAVVCAINEDQEAKALRVFWDLFSSGGHLIGFNCVNFDVPVLLRRSLYLGVQTPPIVVDKYRHPQITDLQQILSHYGAMKLRPLSFYARRFGLPALEGGGAEVPSWVAAGEWDKVEAHLRADLVTTAALARRMGHWA